MTIPEDFGDLLAELALLDQEKQEMDAEWRDFYRLHDQRLWHWCVRNAELIKALREHTDPSHAH